MFDLDSNIIVLLGITFFAAFVDGALGYGFSSQTVPVALAFHPNRVFIRALAIVDVFLNLYVPLINIKRKFAVQAHMSIMELT